MTDAELEFRRAVEQYADMIFRLAFSYTGNRADAEDVMQETLLKLYTTQKTGQKTFASPEHERYWIVRVTANECKHILRSVWHRRTGPLETAAEMAVFDKPEQSELFREVMALPPKYRAAIYLHYYEGYSVQEIAKIMNANASTVQTWLMRARGQLKSNLLNLQEAESL